MTGRAPGKSAISNANKASSIRDLLRDTLQKPKAMSRNQHSSPPTFASTERSTVKETTSLETFLNSIVGHDFSRRQFRRLARQQHYRELLGDRHDGKAWT